MSAIASPRAGHPLAGVNAPMNTLRNWHNQSVGAVRTAVQRIGGVKGAADKVWTAARNAGTAVTDLKSRATPSIAPVKAVGRNSGIAADQLKNSRERSKSSGRAAKRLADSGGGFGKIVDPLGSVMSVMSPLLTGLGVGLAAGAVAMVGISIAMQSNPFGGAAIAVVIIIDLIIDFALNSEAGQRLIKKGFGKLREGFEWIKKNVLPIISKARTAVADGIEFVRKRIVEPLASVKTTVKDKFAAARDGIRDATNGLIKLFRDPWDGIKAVVKPVAEWLEDKIPPEFGKVRDATVDTLQGIADAVRNGLGTIGGILQIPGKFAEWLIDAWENIDFKKLFDPKAIGKKITSFLAEGGLVSPPHGALPGSITPLGDVAGLRAAEPNGRDRRGVRRPRRVESFHEPAGAGAYEIADELLFLARAA
ncbi:MULTISPECIES: hypothetical protein [Streptomyces]|uniref:Tape-measure protein n=1 Tax=Streptomyces tsukubensis (strain DSM 42081 / NBRC 108919 / NRRL 18488 / 9993) TaxID=1114943 RepID=I2N4A7_STRT9|nr:MULTISPECIES: hypothetical protein [Streptomyces]AZK95929.1 hypothetical protein B7R87_20230 [Streptomyces tsukubensis]EIF91854.1 hypothetical protein [Streptomyces tsukubensis NRRL18488]MYS68530.1 hypothetical protein [Streptomyces sp. SID5473]QKM68052.1 hypothetical protein STSU_013555 [Streptomyces tsukubensis NRRL18488]TAI44452.1 hypothetical protein EWI31_13350 [Streptomyces tsukubensis]